MGWYVRIVPDRISLLEDLTADFKIFFCVKLSRAVAGSAWFLLHIKIMVVGVFLHYQK